MCLSVGFWFGFIGRFMAGGIMYDISMIENDGKKGEFFV